tara:strand:- start:95 stop:238 length:144 start_codon:yes stop_codon:yes gene_type:complete
MKYQKDGWNYLHEYRRYQSGVHQILKEGKWITINFKENKPPNSNVES